MFKYLFIVIALVRSLSANAQKQVSVLEVPGRSEFTQIREDNSAVLPSGRYLKPAGKLVRITHDPFGMAVSPDGSRIVTLHNGVFSVIDANSLSVTRVPSYDKKIPSPLSNGSFLGIAIAPDNSTVYLSGGDNGAVIVYDIKTMSRLDSISLNGKIGDEDFDDSFTADLLLLEDGRLLVLDRGNFRMVIVDPKTRKLLASVGTGRQPFGISISRDKKTVFVANVGMYEYPLITGATKENYNSMLIPWHPYADGSKEAIEGTVVEGKKVPGVGSPLHEDAMSVFAIDLASLKVVKKYKTGYQVGEIIEDAEVVGGASPNSIAVGKKYVYVSNATNDMISVIDHQQQKIVKQIPVVMDEKLRKYRGAIPFGLCLSKDESTLYVALLAGNAVAVIDTRTGATKGLIPTGWGPTRVSLSPDEKEMYIISCRGLGAGPNGGKNFVAPVQGTYVGDIQLGSFQKLKTPSPSELAAYTGIVKGNTFQVRTVKDDGKNPLPPLPGLRKSPVKHIVYITKENRTYDEVMGQIPTGRGDSTLARFGVRVELIKDRPSDISPNHLKIARQFAFSDNFYCDSDASIHGHHWMVGVIPNEWVETNSSVDKSARIFSKAPGRRFPGSTGSMDPEDYAEIGGLWEALERKGVEFYNFGEANETAHVREEWSDTLTGASHGVMVPMQKALFSRTSHNYAGYNTNIPDQFRMDQFEHEFTEMWLKGDKNLPPLITIQLPNDHTASPRPEDGYPYQHSFVADNDLALGRLLHFLSRTPYWKDMLVVITEDDPQGGVDHVDAHRSILMLAGPYVKKQYVSHTHANFGSILKMIYNILNVPYVNQYDVTASLIDDFFTDQPDLAPYSLEFPDKAVFDWELAMKKYNRTTDWRKIMQGPPMDDPRMIRKVHYKGDN
ncbi:MAG TPA: bifunctional YncE family protein/alkaline phosphatase family protein [Chitinophagaceae bacterium]|nr:bifunctional YncE family protein/alkaline phosphatase family protein [Chitinophagaceae bacterium]